MENKFYTEDFEQLLKEKSDEFRMYPSKRVWYSIYNDLHPSRKWPSVAMSMVLVMSLLLIGYFNTNDNTSSALQMTTNPGTETGANYNGNKDPKIKNSAAFNTSIVPENNSANIITGSNTTPASNTVNSNSPSNSVSPVNPGKQPANAIINTKTDRITDTYNSTSLNNTNNVIETMDSYINTNQLIADVSLMNAKNKKTITGNPITTNRNTVESDDPNSTLINKLIAQNSTTKTLPSNLTVKEDKKTAKVNESTALKAGLLMSEKITAYDEKSWIEDYALHNKSARKKWKDRVSIEFYVTPNIGYRKLENIAKPEPTVTSFTANPQQSQSMNLNKSVNQKPSLGVEAGIGLSYSFAKKLRLKAGLQFNYTNYSINADETKHPFITTLLLNDITSDYSYLASRTTTYSNTTNLHPVKLHNKTYQLSIPVGLAIKLAGNKKLEWYAGASIQPTYVFGGNANLVSSDYQNYVKEPSMISRWNLNTGVETYITYKLGNYSLQVGPQFRYQIMSTYNKKYTIKENLYNAGLKIGIVKGF